MTGGFLRHPYVVHLRLGFNLRLTPIFLWGVLLAGGRLDDPRSWLAFVALHVFLYGGTTAFNSYYDRDEGPVGGLFAPPAVEEGLLRFSLLFQALGAVPAALVGGPFLAAFLLLFLIFTAYSHPAVRLKANPGLAILTIAAGQGGLGFALGWLAVAPPAGLLQPVALLGALCTALVVTGLYLVTQSYQVAEDAGRGDLTLPVLLGVRGALLLAQVPLVLGGALLVAWSYREAAPVATLLLVVFFLCLAVWLNRWAVAAPAWDTRRNFHAAMRFSSVASAGLTIYLLLQLV